MTILSVNPGATSDVLELSHGEIPQALLGEVELLDGWRRLDFFGVH
jgi:hypothetical protein